MKPFSVLVLFCLVICGKVSAQGFINLDFEQAVIVPTESPGFAQPEKALPGWNVSPRYPGVPYNNKSLGGAMGILYGPGWNRPTDIIEGTYSFRIHSSFSGTINQPAYISQVGFFPVTANSLLFLAKSGFEADPIFEVSIDGNFLPVRKRIAYEGAHFYSVDTRPWRGQTAELRFSTGLTTPFRPGSVILDSIQFSTIIVPEPSFLSLCWLAGLPMVIRAVLSPLSNRKPF